MSKKKLIKTYELEQVEAKLIDAFRKMEKAKVAKDAYDDLKNDFENMIADYAEGYADEYAD